MSWLLKAFKPIINRPGGRRCQSLHPLAEGRGRGLGGLHAASLGTSWTSVMMRGGG